MESEESEPVAPTSGRSLPRVIAVANQKGGVGKTTTTINVGACLAELGLRTLIVDLDPQGNASTGLGIENRGLETSMYHVLMHDVPLENCIEPTDVKHLFVAPASLDLAGAEIELVPAFSRETRLRRAIEAVLDDYDYILIDCPPSLGLLTVNGLAAATEVLVPIQMRVLRARGSRPVAAQRRPRPAQPQPARSRSSTIVCVMYDARTKLADQVVNEVRDHFGDKVVRGGRAAHRCGCRRHRRSGSRSSPSIRSRAARSPTATSPRRCTMARRSGLGKGLSSLIPPGRGDRRLTAAGRRPTSSRSRSPTSRPTRTSRGSTSTRSR